jgi:hypothetical protein
MNRLRIPTGLLLVSLSCSLSALPKPAVLLTQDYINYAWGFVHQGWLIDSTGHIRNYTIKLSDSMEYKPLNQAYLEKLLSLSSATGKSVPLDTLKRKAALLPSASQGILWENGLCADFGTLAFNGFLYDSAKAKYSEVICLEAGDRTGCNSSPSARQIARWLISLDSLPPVACMPPDSCLGATVAVQNIFSKRPAAPDRRPNSMYYLNGKKAPNFKEEYLIRNKSVILGH